MDPQETKKTVRTFAFASFFNDLGSDMIYPIWPLFVTNVLGANMAVLGLIDGLGEALVSISQAVSGYWSDRIRKRKVFIWLGYLFGGVSRLGYAFSSAWPQLIPFRILDRAGKMRGAPRDAIIADVSTQENRGKNFGFLRTMDNLGAVVGIILCILLVEKIGYRNLFLLAAVPSVIAVTLIMIGIKEGKGLNTKVFKGFSFKMLDKNFQKFLFLSAVFSLGSFTYSFLLVFAKQYGFKTAFVPVLYLIFTMFAAGFSLPFGKLADKIGRRPTLQIAFALWILVCLVFITAKGLPAIVLGFVLYGLHKAALEPVQKAFASELAPTDFRASSLGTYQMVIGLCALPASLLAGFLWDSFGDAAPFYLSMALTAGAGVLLLGVKEVRLAKGN
jgi:MFS family permease